MRQVFELMTDMRDDSGQKPGRWVKWGLVLAWVLACLPLLFIKILPSTDFPDHLARCFILARGDASYWQFYSPHWALLPNLALEMIIVPLAHVLSIQASAKVFFALMFAISIYSGARLNKTLAGEWSLYGLAPALLIYNRVLAYGFVNYLFGIAILPLALALHIENRDKPLRRFWMDALFMVVLFTAHLIALAFFVACALAYDVIQMRGEKGWLKRLGVDVASLFAPLIVLGGLMAAGSPTTGEASGMTFSHIVPKLMNVVTTLRSGQSMWDWVFLGLVVVGLVVLAMRGKVRFVTSAWPMLLVLALIFLVAPERFKYTSFVDARIPLMIGVVALAALAPAKGAGSRMAGLLFGALLLFRAGTTTATYAFWQHRIDRAVTDLHQVPSGSILLAARQGSSQFTEVDGWYPRLRHAGCILLMDRPVMANDLFTNPTQQPLLKKPPYNQFELTQALGAGDKAALDGYAQQAIGISRKNGLLATPMYVFYLRQAGKLDLPPSLKPVVVRKEYAVLRIDPSAAPVGTSVALPKDSEGF